jgi:ribosomal protein S18 acetylase RimI-like enzyme
MESQIIVRPAEEKDQKALENFLRFEFYIHQHLDWRPILDWLGFQPFLIAQKNDEIIACLAAPSEVNGVAWIRLFACSSKYSNDEVWDILFKSLSPYYPGKINMIAVLGIHNWFVNLLLTKSFTPYQNIIVFEWHQKKIQFSQPMNEITIQRAGYKDLSEIAVIDSKSFAPLWQLPEESLQKAFQQSGYTTIALHNGKTIGYQMCTESCSNAHLARLAVDPEYQRNKIGSALLYDLLNYYVSHGIYKITVNTQDDNFSSQSLYSRFGFIKTEEKYPVLIYV